MIAGRPDDRTGETFLIVGQDTKIL